MKKEKKQKKKIDLSHLTPEEKEAYIKKRKKQKRMGDIFLGFLFLIGLLILLYPTISNFYYKSISGEAIDDFTHGKSQLGQEEIEERLALARAFNDSLIDGTGEGIEDPYSEEERAAGKAEYARMLEINEKMGYLRIPKMTEELPVYAGTVEEVLQKGVGHLEGTSLPVGGNSTHAVLTAHRGLPDKKLFRELDKLQVGDRFYYHNIGETLAYQVDHVEIIEPTAFEKLLVAPGHDYMTLLTCHPYMVNSHRLIVRGHRIPYVEAQEEKDLDENKTSKMYQYLFYATLAVLIMVLINDYRKEKERKKAALLKENEAKEAEEIETTDENIEVTHENKDEITEEKGEDQDEKL